MRFKVGQEVVCTKQGAWQFCDNGEISNQHDPKYNEICTVEYISKSRYCECIGLVGFDGDFNVRWFEPLITTSQLEKELESINQTIEV